MAFRLEFFIVDLLPLLFLTLLNIKEIAKIASKLLYLQAFALFIALSVYVFHSDLEFALALFVRFNLIVIFSTLLFFKKDGNYIYSGIAKLPLGERFKSLFFFFIKYAELLLNDLSKLKETLVARGFSAKTDIRSYLTLSSLLALLFIKSVGRAQNLQETFVARGFDGRLFSLQKNSISRHDILLVGVLILNLFGVLFELHY